MNSFHKIVSNLAFNPSLMDQLFFYSKRLKREQAIRKLGVVMIIFSMFIQIFAAMVPPEKSLAASNNDVIYGGVKTLEQLKAKHNNRADVQALYKRFGLTSADMTHRDTNLVSFGFQSQGAKGTRTVGRVNFTSTRDQAIGPYAGTTFYSRNAAEWQGKTPAYYFGRQKGSDGKYFYVWVLKDCGNIAYRTAPAPPVRKPKPKPKPKPAPTPAPAPAPVRPVATPVPVKPTPTPVIPKPVPPPPKIPPPEIELSKSVRNITQNLSAEQSATTPARAGDVIEYTLVTRSKNATVANNFEVEDYIGDVLDYSTLDQGSMSSSGGTFEEATRTVSWKSQTVPASGQLEKVFRVTMMNPLPSTNQPNATASDFDCKMQNGYGNEISMPVDCAVIKEVEQLPNTGPGTTIAAAFAVTSFSGYFLARTRLLGRELGIIKDENNGQGQ